jgi:hypothetical protein
MGVDHGHAGVGRAIQSARVDQRQNVLFFFGCFRVGCRVRRCARGSKIEKETIEIESGAVQSSPRCRCFPSQPTIVQKTQKEKEEKGGR